MTINNIQLKLSCTRRGKTVLPSQYQLFGDYPPWTWTNRNLQEKYAWLPVAEKKEGWTTTTVPPGAKIKKIKLGFRLQKEESSRQEETNEEATSKARHHVNPRGFTFF